MADKAVDKLDEYYNKANIEFDASAKMPFASYYQENLENGETSFYQKHSTLTKLFEEDWVDMMEAIFPSIDKIIRNPKLSIRYDEEIVPIEKAKKTNAASVRHLASHTQLIREVNGDEVRPKKILTQFAEEEIAIYENRFIKTLIDRTYNFVKNRYEIIKDNVESFQKDHMVYESSFPIKDEKVNFKLDILVQKTLDNASINRHNEELLHRAEVLMTMISGYKNSPFMKQLKNAKKVLPPIMKTNIILKNSDFKDAYSLWLYLDRYNSLAFDTNVKERDITLTEEFKESLDRVNTYAFAALKSNLEERKEDYNDLELDKGIRKRSTKIVRKLDSDIIKRPDSLEVEDTAVNEYYANINRDIFNEKLKEEMDKRVSEPVACKRVINQALDITNTMFDSVFEIDENVDMFSKFLEIKPIEKYKEAKEKVRIAKIIREAKEKDLRKSYRLERSLYKVMVSANKERIKVENEKKNNDALKKYTEQMERNVARFKADNEKIDEKISILDGSFIIDEETTELDKEIKEMDLVMKTDKERLDNKSKEKLDNKLERMKASHEKKMAKLEEDRTLRLARAKQLQQRRALYYKEQIRIANEKEKARLALLEEQAIEAKKAMYKEIEDSYKAETLSKVAYIDSIKEEIPTFTIEEIEALKARALSKNQEFNVDDFNVEKPVDYSIEDSDNESIDLENDESVTKELDIEAIKKVKPKRSLFKKKAKEGITEELIEDSIEQLEPLEEVTEKDEDLIPDSTVIEAKVDIPDTEFATPLEPIIPVVIPVEEKSNVEEKLDLLDDAYDQLGILPEEQELLAKKERELEEDTSLIMEVKDELEELEASASNSSGDDLTTINKEEVTLELDEQHTDILVSEGDTKIEPTLEEENVQEEVLEVPEQEASEEVVQEINEQEKSNEVAIEEAVQEEPKDIVNEINDQDVEEEIKDNKDEKVEKQEDEEISNKIEDKDSKKGLFWFNLFKGKKKTNESIKLEEASNIIDEKEEEPVIEQVVVEEPIIKHINKDYLNKPKKKKVTPTKTKPTFSRVAYSYKPKEKEDSSKVAEEVK